MAKGGNNKKKQAPERKPSARETKRIQNKDDLETLEAKASHPVSYFEK
jgi:hypothetical protein